MGMASRLALIVRFNLHDPAANTLERQGASDELWCHLDRWPDKKITGNAALLRHVLSQTVSS
jgi:hypothetical protein